MTQTEMTKCPNCTDGVRSTEPVTIKCGTCWGEGYMSVADLARAKMLAGVR